MQERIGALVIRLSFDDVYDLLRIRFAAAEPARRKLMERIVLEAEIIPEIHEEEDPRITKFRDHSMALPSGTCNCADCAALKKEWRDKDKTDPVLPTLPPTEPQPGNVIFTPTPIAAPCASGVIINPVTVQTKTSDRQGW